ncbi:hypothetical protein MNBD_UNCLBAC01-271 [hydrothermal vent metagenome]|uniref:Uncharacterized protein n=1 Tax=hydrothermal vent metagenome TaxID=652676 RepID=A0A3B1DG37_9ZZZZ
MSKEVLDEREFELVNIIGARLGSNQRDLSRQMNLSLGQTNMLIRRLVSKGFIRISQLNQRKVKYLLTPKGIAEKMRKSVKYTLNTINSIGLIKERLRGILSRLHHEGERVFYVLGKSDFVILVEMVFAEMAVEEYTLTKIAEIPLEHLDGILLIGEERLPEGFNGHRYINLVEELAKVNDPLMDKVYQN